MAKVGNPGYGKVHAIRQGVEKLTPRYFDLLEAMINGEDKDDRKFSMTELGKLMGKMIPTTLEGSDDAPLKIQVITYGSNHTSQLPAAPVPTSASSGDGFG
jgi:hypothetical protein